MNTKRIAGKAGFTLIEMMIVLVVIAVLAAILLPVFLRVREKARCTTCQSNLKQIAVAMQQYVQESDGHYPVMEHVQDGKTIYWNDAITPYVKDGAIFRCPTRQQANPENPETDYGYNWMGLNTGQWDSNSEKNLFGNTQFAGVHESSIVPSSSVVALNYEGGPSSVDGGPDTDVVETSWGQRLWLPALHSGGANVSYIDGHVKWRSKQEQTGAG